jgi:hypothetical protein
MGIFERIAELRGSAGWQQFDTIEPVPERIIDAGATSS